MYAVQKADLSDIPEWLHLAEEVEPLFGPMVADPGFREGLAHAIERGHAFCARMERPPLHGGIVIAPAENEILWLAVRRSSRGCGVGKALLAHAMACLGAEAPIAVTTFDDSIAAGLPARSLYHRCGFRVERPGPLNPAGIATVVLLRRPGATTA